MSQVIFKFFDEDQSVRDMIDFIICRDFCNLAEHHERFVVYRKERLSKFMNTSKIDSKIQSKDQPQQPCIPKGKNKDVQIGKQQLSQENSLKKHEKKMESIEVNINQQKVEKHSLKTGKNKQLSKLPSSKQFSLPIEKYDSKSIMKTLEDKIQQFQPLVESDEQGCDYMLQDDAIGGEDKRLNNHLPSTQVSKSRLNKKQQVSGNGNHHEDSLISNQIAYILANEARPNRMEYKQTVYQRKPIKYVSESSSDGEMIIQDEDFIVGRTKIPSQVNKPQEDIKNQDTNIVKASKKAKNEISSSSSDEDLQIIDDINE